MCRGKRAVLRCPELVCRSHAKLLQSQCRPLGPGGPTEAATGLSPGWKESSSWPSLLLLLGITELAALPRQAVPVPRFCVAQLLGMTGRQCHQTPFRAGKPQRHQGEGRGKIQELSVRRGPHAALKAVVWSLPKSHLWRGQLHCDSRQAPWMLW